MPKLELIIAAADNTLLQVLIHEPAGVLSIEHPGVESADASPRLYPGIGIGSNTKQLIQTYWDVEEPHPQGPNEELVREGLDFMLQFPPGECVLVQCFRGKARSCAMAIGFLHARHPDWPVSKITETLKEIRPQAAPNILIVQILDKILKTGGVLEQAVLADTGLSANRARANMNRRKFMEKNPYLFPAHKAG